MTAPRSDLARVVLLALGVTMCVSLPVMRSPSERIFGMEIAGRHHDPFTVMEQFSRLPGAGLHSQVLTDVPGALLARVVGPVAAYNYLVLLSFPLSVAAAYALARHLSISSGAATLAALAFAFSPFHLAQAAYHPQIAQTQWLPLYLLALWRCLDNATVASAAALAAAALAVTLSNFYGGLIAAAITPAAVAGYWYFRRRPAAGSSWSAVVTIATLVLAAGAAGAYAAYSAHAVVVDRAAFAYPRADLFRYSAKWWSYLVPPVEHPMLGDLARRAWTNAGVREGLLEQQVSLGWGVMILAAVAVFAWARGIDRARGAIPVLTLLALVALACSLWPERLFYTLVPMFRAYARFGVIVQLMAVLMAALGVEYLYRDRVRGSAARACAIALVALAAAEYAVWPPSMSRDVLPTGAHRWVVGQPGPIRALDCSDRTPASESVQWLSAGRISLRDATFDDCTQPQLGDKLAAAGYTHVLVARHSAEGDWFATRPLPGGIRQVARFRDGAAFAVTAVPPALAVVRTAGFYPREHDPARTWRWMGTGASWTIANRGDRPFVAALDVDLSAFQRPRQLRLLLDGRATGAVTVAPQRRVVRLGPFEFSVGEHELAFIPMETPTRADEAEGGRDHRALSFCFATWQWAEIGGRR